MAITMFHPDSAVHSQSRHLMPRRQVVSSLAFRDETMEMLSWDTEARL